MIVCLWVLAGTVAVLVLIALFAPYAGLRLAMAAVTRSVLWLRVFDRANVPPSGPLLLLSAPLSYLAWLILLSACPRRVRFLILAGWVRRGLPGWLLARAGAIVPAGTDSAAVEAALARARRALEQGEAVCVFAEGCRTSDGVLWEYSRVFAALPAVPVLPVVLLQPQGSLFAMHNERFVSKWPPSLPSPVEVTFGEPRSGGAAEARQALQELSARAAIARNGRSMPVHRRFVRMATRNPFRTCWIDSTAPGDDMSYGKAYVAAVCLSRLLRARLGDTRMVAIWLPPGRGGALANIAVAFLGKVAVNLNYTSSHDVVRSCLSQCDCRHVLTAKRFTARVPLDAGPGVEVIYLEDLLPLVTAWDKTITYLSVLLLPGWVLDRFVRQMGGHKPDDLATVIFSSGSTGDPKGIMLTHGNIAGNLESMIQSANLAPRDRLLGVLPFFHSFGYTVTLWGPLQIGASAVFHPDPRQAEKIGELCRTHRATVYLSTATFLRFCLRKCEPDDFRSLRLLICGAEKLPPALALEFKERFGLLPLEGYGCTELSPVVSTNLADQPCDDMAQVYNRIGTVGAPLHGIVARAADPDTLEPRPLGEEGVLLITGANVMQGYLHRPDLTAQVLHEGWYVTGDMGRLDAEGHLTITGRLSRFAKVGGEMVPLEMIEEALHEVLAAAERACAVTCVPDEARGERVVVLYLATVLVEWGKGLHAWREGLTVRGLPNLWVPHERDFHAVPDLPILGTGKLNLKGIKELALDLARR